MACSIASSFWNRWEKHACSLGEVLKKQRHLGYDAFSLTGCRRMAAYGSGEEAAEVFSGVGLERAAVMSLRRMGTTLGCAKIDLPPRHSPPSSLHFTTALLALHRSHSLELAVFIKRPSLPLSAVQSAPRQPLIAFKGSSSLRPRP